MHAQFQPANQRGRQPHRRYARLSAATLAVLIGVTGAGCGAADPAAHSTALPATPPRGASSGGPHKLRSPSAVATTASALPALCRAPRRLAPVADAGQAPTGFRRVDWIRTTLGAQFPTVWGGLAARGPQNDFIFQETVRDRALESEVERYFPSPIFEVVPYSVDCLQAISNAISSTLGRPNDPLQLISVGIGKERVEVGSTACTPAAADKVLRWFQLRYGDTVSVATCQSMPVAEPATAAVGH